MKGNMASREIEITFKDGFKFSLHQIIIITELERSGIVKAILINDHGVNYEVRYFYNGEAKSVYFYEHELEEVKNDNKNRS